MEGRLCSDAGKWTAPDGNSTRSSCHCLANDLDLGYQVRVGLDLIAVHQGRAKRPVFWVLPSIETGFSDSCG